ncbi:MAG: phage tail tape measure protein, partial [Candidatus Heimdallarchaeaceae archaeon]
MGPYQDVGQRTALWRQQRETSLGRKLRPSELQVPGSELFSPAYIKNIQGGAYALKNVQAELEKVGFSMDDLTEVKSDLTRGITQFNAAVKDSSGHLRTASVVTDKHGNTVKSTQKHLRTFTDTIRRNIGEVFKWAVAVGVVYGGYRKLQELLQKAIDIQSKLIDVEISLSGAQLNVNKVFDSASTIASDLGIDLMGVTEGYVSAFRAVGSIEDPTLRATAATNLLRDSMILAKLSGMEHAQALDTLAGALRQTGKDFDAGQDLLDKWVAVSKNANVSLETLAESFAITATSAENVGIDIDKLNGIIATVAEVTTLSATESGNAVRAFISGFQTKEAEKELVKYGISIRDAKGELLSFVDVIETIVQRQKVGILSDRDVAQLSEAIGGGARRGAQVNAFLENYARVSQLAGVSANAFGDAQDALNLKLKAVETSSIRLDNAFTVLAQTLGDEGGILNSTSNLLDLFTGLVNVLDKVVEVLGPATQGLIALGAVWGISGLSGVKARLAKPLGETFLGGMLPTKAVGLGGIPRFPTQGMGLKEALTGTWTGMGLTGLGIGVGASFLSGDMQKMFERQDYAWEKVGAQIGGSIVGTLIAGGNPIGGVIGSAIADNLIGRMEVDGADIVKAWVAEITPLEDELSGDRESKLKQAESEIRNILRDIAGPTGDLKRRLLESQRYNEPLREALGLPKGTYSEEDYAMMRDLYLAKLVTGDITENYRKYSGSRGGGRPSHTVEGLPILNLQATDEQAQKMREMLEIAEDLGLIEPIELLKPATLERVKQVEGEFSDLIDQLSSEEMSKRTLNVIRGLESPTSLKNFKDDLDGLDNNVLATVAVLREFDQELYKLGSEDDLIRNLFSIFSENSSEATAQITNLVNEIVSLEDKLAARKYEDRGFGPYVDPEIAKELAKDRQELDKLLSGFYRSGKYRAFEIPSIMEVSPDFISQKDAIMQEYKTLEEEYVEA